MPVAAAARGAAGVLRAPLVAPTDGDPNDPDAIEGVPVAHRLRTRRDGSGALVALADGRYAATSADLLAVGGRRPLAEWCARRVARRGAELRRAGLVAGARRRPERPEPPAGRR